MEELKPLGEEEIRKRFARLEAGWEIEEEKRIKRVFIFKTFRESIEFIMRIADIAEKENHYPEIHIKYAQVMLELTTEKVNGLSEIDFDLARQIDFVYGWKTVVERFIFSQILSLKVLVIITIILLAILIWKRYF